MNKSRKRTKVIVICLALLVILAAAGIFVYYQTQYFLVLNGDKEVEVNLCQTYEDPGASAKKGGKDVSDEIEVRGNVRLEIPGTYTLTYTLGNLEVQRRITVKNKMDPVLKLKGKDSVEIKLGEDFEDPGFSASDGSGKNLTKKVKVDKPRITKAGKTKITYTVADSTGKSTTVTRQVTVLPNTEYQAAGLPICMFHYVYDETDPPEDLNRRFGNYIESHDLEEELNWLKAEDYYFPTWKEVRDYVDGKLLLPEKSIALCFDDGAKSFLDIGIPVLEKCKVPATCFMITSENGAKKIKKYPSKYVSYQSHSHNMHRPGGSIGHGGIFTALSEEEALEDLKKSVEICGNGDAFAYPYGDYTKQCRDILEVAGFRCAVTTESGKARPGMDPLLLPRVRMAMGQSLQSFQSMVSPPSGL